MSFVPVNPRPFLQDLVNKDVVVRLKWGETEYKGRLVVRNLLFSFSSNNTLFASPLFVLVPFGWSFTNFASPQ